MNRVLALGEVLWDVLPTGAQFGGAPANFACAVAELGKGQVEVAIASAVGDDELGRKALAELASHGVGTQLVATNDRPTGRVDVTMDAAGIASYCFVDDPAWDHITGSDSLNDFARSADVVCFGSLGQRSDASRNTIQRSLEQTRADAWRIFDVNLRPPFWTQSTIAHSLERANVVKLNEVELPLIAQMFQLNGSDEVICQLLLERFHLRLIALTRGAGGSLLITDRGGHSDVECEAVSVNDTVGAGDAFTAALALGLCRGMPLDDINRWASRVAGYVCTQPGGTPRLPEHLHFAEVRS